MIATNAGVVLANAQEREFGDFDISKAWKAVKKNAYTPSDHDTDTLYYDREPGISYEARPGLTSYMKQGWVYNDDWPEAGSRTLDYAFNDYACSVVAAHSGEDDATVQALKNRSGNFAYLWNNKTQFMQARNANGTWANNSFGWTEGDDYVYTFDVMHDMKGLARLFNGRQAFCDKLDAHFQGGHNDHTNEPSHHSALGYPNQAAETIRDIAWANYNTTSGGLGQMSAWYVFSALGFYPVNPASDEYIVGTPFFEEVSIQFPSGASTGGRAANDRERRLEIRAPGAPTKPYIRSLKVDGKRINPPNLKHSQLVNVARIGFEMRSTPTSWGSRPLWET
ncbi:Alpha-1-2-mannosidase [Penicillium concentricum]|uniref:Alpha-1-2-mannosidase n=1 Tax=Penicillium concentricum TaxID=293559 RepID=A0A9W9V9S6_9EURO|nr:Alpha-1-2-mannosidase [Penicillium concentricum]KAJ5371635.1 Alpha-1-2-mannosidase [Penicillium concentricum]